MLLLFISIELKSQSQHQDIYSRFNPFWLWFYCTGYKGFTQITDCFNNGLHCFLVFIFYSVL